MKIGYIDTSILVAIAFDEPAGRKMAGRLRTFRRCISSNLLEAEYRSTLRREGIDAEGEDLLAGITWIYPDRPLTREYERVLSLGLLRGAGLYHLACALFLAPRTHELSFLTRDGPQKELARKLGFTV